LGVAAASSIAQIELNAKAMGNLFCAPLISDQVAWRGNNIGLPPVGMILADNDLQTGSSDFRSDHLSEAFCGDAFLDHGEFPKAEVTVTIRSSKSERSVKKHGLPRSVYLAQDAGSSSRSQPVTENH
jgi:hypothetical protein